MKIRCLFVQHDDENGAIELIGAVDHYVLENCPEALDELVESAETSYGDASRNFIDIEVPYEDLERAFKVPTVKGEVK